MNENKGCKSLGKGEVVVSITTGSTRFPSKIKAPCGMLGYAFGMCWRNNAGTWNADVWKMRGMCSRAVPAGRHPLTKGGFNG